MFTSLKLTHVSELRFGVLLQFFPLECFFKRFLLKISNPYEQFCRGFT